MIKVITNIKAKIKNIPFLTSNSITNHLGINPKKGGKPPKDNNNKNKEIFINLFEWNILKVWLILNNLKLLNKYTIEKFKKQ